MNKSFKDFLTEATVGKNNMYSASVRIIKYLEKNLAKEFVDFDGQSYSNASGTYFGYIFVCKSDESAIRINWEENKFHSINIWSNWEPNEDPDSEIFVKDLGPEDRSFVKILPQIAEIIKEGDVEESAEVNESILLEKRVEFEGQTFDTKVKLVEYLYEHDYPIEDIVSITKFPVNDIKKMLTVYLYGQKASIEEIEQALGVNKNDIRRFIGLRNTEDEDDNPRKNSKGSIKVLKGAKETIIPSKSEKIAEKKLSETEFADPDLVFDEINDYATLVAKGVMPALLITGQGGIGKSYGVEKILNEYGKKGDTWIKVKGKASASAMYATLWYNRNKIIVFDDCDSVLKDADALNILKGALDSADEREISWATKAGDMVYTLDLNDNDEIAARVQEWSAAHSGKEGFPNHFMFEGEVIFISNMRKSEIYKKDAALLTRCTCVDVVLTARDALKRIKTVLPYIKIYKSMGSKDSEGKDITDEDLKQEVFDWISSEEFLNNPRMRGKDMNFRLFQGVYKLKWAGLPNWKERSYACGG